MRPHSLCACGYKQCTKHYAYAYATAYNPRAARFAHTYRRHKAEANFAAPSASTCVVSLSYEPKFSARPVGRERTVVVAKHLLCMAAVLVIEAEPVLRAIIECDMVVCFIKVVDSASVGGMAKLELDATLQKIHDGVQARQGSIRPVAFRLAQTSELTLPLNQLRLTVIVH